MAKIKKYEWISVVLAVLFVFAVVALIPTCSSTRGRAADLPMFQNPPEEQDK